MADNANTEMPVTSIVTEVEVAKKVDAVITRLCTDPNVPSPQRRLLNEALTSLKSVNNNLIESLPSNRRVACLRLQRAGKLRKRESNAPAVQSTKKKIRLDFLPLSPSVEPITRDKHNRKAKQKTLKQRTKQELEEIRKSHEAMYKEEVAKIMNIENDSGDFWPASPRLIGRILFKVPSRPPTLVCVLCVLLHVHARHLDSRTCVCAYTCVVSFPTYP